MKIGDNIEICTLRGTETMLVIRQMTFEEFCGVKGVPNWNLSLLKSNWRKYGPTFEVLRADGSLEPVWPA
jgi:hypothetical protein